MEFLQLVDSLNIGVLAPEIIVLFSILLILILDLSLDIRDSFLFSSIGLFGLVLTLICLFFEIGQSEQLSFLGSFKTDGLSVAFRIFFVLSSFISILLSLAYFQSAQSNLAEFLIFLLTATLGCMFLAGSNDLIILFIAFETLGFSSYLMAAYLKQEKLTNEGALKYLLTGAMSSGFFLYGLSWLYGLSAGHLEMNYLGASLLNGDFSNSFAVWISFLFILVGVGFKLTLVPFHQWAPDVYQGIPTPVAAFLSVSSKAAGLVFTLRILTVVFPFFFVQWNLVFQVISILSMAIGSFVALTQNSFKRLLGYSSIAQAGFLLIGLLCANQVGYSSLLVYLFVYLFMNLGTFACLILFSLLYGTDEMKDYSGLVTKDPLLASCLALCLLSLAGMPPLAGFFAKIYLFLSGWASGFYVLIFISLITTVISIYYTLKIVKLLFFPVPSSAINLKFSFNSSLQLPLVFFDPLRIAIFICTFISTISGLFLDQLIQFANFIVESTSSLPTLNLVPNDIYF